MIDAQVVRLRAEKLVAGGDALARLDDGRVAFVEGAIPGELVDARVLQSKTSFVRAEADSVIEASSDRVVPDCVHRKEGCGGCAWMHIDLHAQRDFKIDVVVDAFSRIAKLSEPSVIKGQALPALGSRRVMRLIADDSGRLGLRASQSNDVVAIKNCAVAVDSINTLFAHDGWTPGEEIIVHADKEGEGLAIATDSRVPESVRSIARVGDRAFTKESIRGVELRVDAQSFYQGCRDADLVLVDAVERAAEREYLDGEHGSVIDAYGGVGLFAASLVPPEVRCIVVELAPAAVDDARINLSGRNVQVVESAVEDWEPEPAGLVIADPSRKGLGAEAIEVLVGTGADRIVLVSCDAAAGARDINLLTKRGYELVYSEVLDLFPNTSHVEVVSRLDRA